MKQSWISLLLLLASSSVAAQVFSHDTGRVHWEAEVTADTVALRERREGAAAGSEFVCPLGPAVRATAVSTGSDAGKVCLVFSKDKCAYKSGESAPGHPIAQPGAATFKCVDFATAEHANTLAALINAGPHPRRHASPVRSPASSKGPGDTARPSRAALPASAPQNGPPAPLRSASKPPPPAFASGEADPAIAKLLARAQERAAGESSSDAPASAIPMPNAKPSPQEGKPAPSSVSRLEGGRGP